MPCVLSRPWFSKISGGKGVGVKQGGGVQGRDSQDGAVFPVWFGPSTEPAGLIRT